MRAKTRKIAEAFKAGEFAKVRGTETDGRTVWLHGHAIAVRRSGKVYLTLAGWPTATTRERLNGISEVMGLGVKFFQRDGNQWMMQPDGGVIGGVPQMETFVVETTPGTPITRRVILNSFQKWAIKTLSDAGIKAGVRGNWVEVDGESVMTEQGVLRMVSEVAA